MSKVLFFLCPHGVGAKSAQFMLRVGDHIWPSNVVPTPNYGVPWPDPLVACLEE